MVPGATVKVTNIGTNQVRTATTAGNGEFSVADLEPVEYRLEISAQGFKKEVIDHVKVDTASIATVNVQLETGSVDTKVTVEASAVMIDTSSGTLSSTVTQRQIEDAPLLNRSVLDLALTLPNVGGDAGSEDPVITSVTPCPGCNLTLGGGRPMSTMIMADGTNNTGISLAAPSSASRRRRCRSYGADLGVFGGIRNHGRRHDQRHHQIRHQRISRHRALV